MSPPEKNMKMKKKKPSRRLQSIPNPSLPHDLLLSIVARVSRVYYPILYLVSKSFRSLLASPELYKTRSLLGCTESCLYVWSQSGTGTSWLTLCRKPGQTLTNDTTKSKENSSGYVLSRVPILHSPPLRLSSLVAVGSNIYNIAGSSNQKPSSSVWILDCRSHTWHEAPSLREGLRMISASVLDRKIYVAGSFRDGDSKSMKNSFEVFDTETQIWDRETITCSKAECDFYSCRTTCIDGKFHVVLPTENQSKAVAYSSKEGRWDTVGVEMNYDNFVASCEIENVLYSCSLGEFRWYDTKARKWRYLKGLLGLPNFCYDNNVKLANYGGKIAVLWEEGLLYYKPNIRKKMIMYAEITLERRGNCEIWGIVECFGDVLTVPRLYSLAKVLPVTL